MHVVFFSKPHNRRALHSFPHDALPIFPQRQRPAALTGTLAGIAHLGKQRLIVAHHPDRVMAERDNDGTGQRRSRSEEHTSELQSRRDLVCRLLLEKKNTKRASTTNPLI